MRANLRKNPTKTVEGVAIRKKFDDVETSIHPDISHPYYKAPPAASQQQSQKRTGSKLITCHTKIWQVIWHRYRY